MLAQEITTLKTAMNARRESIKLPSEPLAEAGALACVLLSESDQAKNRLDALFAELFHDLRYRQVFEALNSLAGQSKSLDNISLHIYLRNTGELDRLGGDAFISQLIDSSPSVEQFPVFLETLKDRATRRAVLQGISEVERLAKDPARPIDSVLKAAEILSAEHPPKRKLPQMVDASSFMANEIPEPRGILKGVLHQGCKLALGGGSKTFKTWMLMDLAISVSHNQPWLGCETTRSRVCYVNFELPDWGLHHRLQRIIANKEVVLAQGWLHIWNLRGYARTYRELLPSLIADLRKQKDLGLLILDPIYKLYGDADENSARDVTDLLNELEQLARVTGAAVAFANHFSKGNQAGKEAADRISGSGVFARDPDAILTFTRHEEDGAFVVDSILRNCKPLDPFVVKWQFPLMYRDASLDPTKLKRTKGRLSEYSADQLLQELHGKPLSSSKWQERVCEETGMSRSKFFSLRKVLESQKAVRKTKDDKWIRSVQPSPENQEPLF